MVRSQHFTTNTQHCGSINTTTSNLQHWFHVASTLDMQRCCNVEIARWDLQRLHNLDTATSNSELCTNVTSTLNSKFTSQRIMEHIPTVCSTRNMLSSYVIWSYQKLVESVTCETVDVFHGTWWKVRWMSQHHVLWYTWKEIFQHH